MTRGKLDAPVVLGSARAEHIESMIGQLAELSEGGPGVTRLAYSPLERRAHALFAQWMSDLGCSVTTDAAGNTIAERPGAVPGRPAIGVGSHLDSVYSGGRFDGIAGVVAGVELVRLLAEAGMTLEHPLRIVAFAGEEGARFGQACVGSKLAAGLTARHVLDELTDRSGTSLSAAMREIGLDPDSAAAQGWDADDWAVFLELHIEQGKVLENSGAAVGPVDLISGSTRLSFVMTGRPSHTGGTPMLNRSDALAAAAEAVLIAETLASDDTHRGTRATVGRLSVEPNSITTIPGRVTFSLDVRDIDADRQRRAVTEIVGRVMATCRRRKVTLEVNLIADTSPVVMPLWVRQALVAGAKELDVPYRVLGSGASHDAQMINTFVPTALLFVPSRDGLSHVPDEWTEFAQVATGVDVLARAVIGLDKSMTASERVASKEEL
ncbi:MAG: amidase, hydantoinase/carbamoylase family [Microbacteriaceae bacterium]|nr:amidase, hydantoinase/carbamoylase family [Microbacteriaceae bacterium]